LRYSGAYRCVDAEKLAHLGPSRTPPSGVTQLARQAWHGVPRQALHSAEPASPPPSARGGLTILQLVEPTLAAGQDRRGEQVIVSVPLDPSLSLTALATSRGLRVRQLRAGLRHPSQPLPHDRVEGKILIRRSACDAWISRDRQVGVIDGDQIVAAVLARLD
jgi:hypothetical protein